MNRRQIRKVAVVVAHPNDETLWVGGTLLMEREPHEEVFRAVFDLWRTGTIVSKSLWLFAYEDGHGSYLPRANRNAHRKTVLSSAMPKSMAASRCF